MKNIHSIEFYTGSKEELLPGFEKDFPYIASRAELDKYIGHYVPWHWHKTVELFYMESGSIEYDTPGGKLLFPAGSGGIVNSNVLHMTKAISQKEKNIQLLHIFDVSLLAGEQGSRIEQKYIAPIITAPQIEVIPLFPGNAEEERILKLLAASFRLSSDEFGYEIKLRETLTEIWLMLFELSRPMREKKGEHNKSNDKIKLMMIYIHEHYREKISIPELAAAAYLSERECYRVFHDCLHMTPVEYIKAYRLQAATHSPDIATLLTRYLSIEREKSRKYSQGWQQQHTAGELQKISKAIVYLQSKGIATLEDLDAALSSVDEEAKRLNTSVVAKQKRMRTLEKFIEHGSNYNRLKPIHDELKTLKNGWGKKREKFEQAHESDLIIWNAANRFLHANLPEGTKSFKVSEWQKEFDELKAQSTGEYEELKTKRSEVKELQQIRKCIDIVEQAEQRTQEQTHQTPRRKKEDISL